MDGPVAERPAREEIRLTIALDGKELPYTAI
jgi:hypothetical protein